MKIQFRIDPTPSPVTSFVELTEAERAAFVEELQRLSGWSQASKPVLHRVWTALKHKEEVL